MYRSKERRMYTVLVVHMHPEEYRIFDQHTLWSEAYLVLLLNNFTSSCFCKEGRCAVLSAPTLI